MGTHVHQPDFTAKGDMLIGTASGTMAVLPVGTNKKALVADSTQTTGMKWIYIPQQLFDHFADAGNVTTGETDLYSDTVAAAQLGTNGDKLFGSYGGVFVSSGTATRQVRLYFAGTAIFDSGALTLSLSAAWTLDAVIIRVSVSIIRYRVSLATEGAALSAYTAAGELTGLTLANTAVLKVTGQAAGVGAATNDIVAKLGYVEWKGAA